MHLDLIQSMCLAGSISIPNDDRVGCGPHHAWLVDGATDLGEPGLLGARGGAAWISANADACFGERSGAIEAICRHVFEGVASAFVRERRRLPIAPWESPRAAFAAIAVEGRRLGCAVSGDCTILHRSTNGVHLLSPAPDRTAERDAAAALGDGVATQLRRSEAALADRQAARSGSRPVFGVDAALSWASTRFLRVEASPGDSVLLMSDGFAALVDTYAAYDANSLFAALEQDGLIPLAQQLRLIEDADPDGARFPRFKLSDDASALWLKLG